jgi:hypothetical protein
MKLFILINSNASIELHDLGYGLFLKLIDGRHCMSMKRVDELKLSEILKLASEMAKVYEQSTNSRKTPSFERISLPAFKRDGK